MQSRFWADLEKTIPCKDGDGVAVLEIGIIPDLIQPNPAFQPVRYGKWLISNGAADFFVRHPNPVVIADRVLADEERSDVEEKLMRHFGINHTPLPQAG